MTIDMPKFPPRPPVLSGACLLAAALALPMPAEAQGYRTLSGSVTYLDRMALPPDAVLLIEVVAPDLSLEAEARIPTDGAQVPLPFSIEVPEGVEATLRAGILSGMTLIRLGEGLPLALSGSDDLGEIVVPQRMALGLDTAYRCGPNRVRVGLVGEGAEAAVALDAGPGTVRQVLQPVPAASGARYEAPTDPGTFFWSRGDTALVALEGAELPECRISLPDAEPPYRATGNEPFWSATFEDATLRLTWLGFDDLTLPIVGSALTGDGEIVVTADDPVQAQRAVLTRAPAICRDTMTGMPHPETVTLVVSMPMGGDTLTGCGGDPVSLLTGRTWLVEEVAGTAVAEGTRPTLGFGTDGRVAGSGGCNRWFAGFDLTGEALTVGPAGTTMMACTDGVMAQERAYLEALAAVSRFDVDAGGVLVLLAGDDPVITARAATDGSTP